MIDRPKTNGIPPHLPKARHFLPQNPPVGPHPHVFTLDFRLSFGMICLVTTLSDRLPT